MSFSFIFSSCSLLNLHYNKNCKIMHLKISLKVKNIGLKTLNKKRRSRRPEKQSLVNKIQYKATKKNVDFKNLLVYDSPFRPVLYKNMSRITCKKFSRFLSLLYFLDNFSLYFGEVLLENIYLIYLLLQIDLRL